MKVMYNLLKGTIVAKRILLFLFMALGIEVVSIAQDKTVTGTVTDSNGEPLIGVSVIVEGTMNGTSTDIDGRFSITYAFRRKTFRFVHQFRDPGHPHRRENRVRYHSCGRAAAARRIHSRCVRFSQKGGFHRFCDSHQVRRHRKEPAVQCGARL